MNKKSDTQLNFANAAGMLASRLSLSPIAGQIYGLLFMSPEPVSLNEMVEKLGISKGSASTNVRALESWGAVSKVWVDNSRRDHYEANTDTLNVLLRRVREGLSRRLEDAKEKMHGLESGLTGRTEEDIFYRDRINMAKKMYGQVMQLLEFLPDQGK